MPVSRETRKAACIAGVGAVLAVVSAAPASAESVCAQGGSECQATGKPEPKSLAFVVRYIDRRPGGEFQVTFENGEVWRQTDRSASVTLERGEQVVIRRATTGKFTLISRSGQSTHVERVH